MKDNLMNTEATTAEAAVRQEATRENYGKFSNAEQLLNAYLSLEKEFTKKSQRLKELESSVLAPKSETVENIDGLLDESGEEAAAATVCSNADAVKTGLNGNEAVQDNGAKDAPPAACYLKSDWHATVENFIKQNPGARMFADEIAAFIVDNPDASMSANPLELAYFNVLKEKFVPPEKLAADEEYLQKFVFGNNSVRQRIILDYLGELQKTKAPALISGETGAFPLSPLKKPRTIKEASVLAEKYFK